MALRWTYTLSLTLVVWDAERVRRGEMTNSHDTQTARTPRILHLTECYAGGVSRAIETIVDLTPEAEHHLLWRGDESPEATIGYASRRDLPASFRRAIRRVRDVVEEVSPDFVYAHSSWAGVFARATRLDAPVVYAPHCYKFDDASTSAPLRTAYRLAEVALARRTARTIVLSPHEEALALAVNKKVPTHYVPNVASVEPDEAHPATRFAAARDVIMIGRLSKQKDPSFFAHVARRVHDVAPDVRFRWIGDGDMDKRAELEAVGVEVTGWLYGEALAAELARPSVYLHTALYEGFPLSVLDAAAFEHPILARHIPAFDGLTIPTAESADDAALMVLDLLSSGPHLAQAEQAARDLRSTMNRDAQRAALQALYAAV